MALSEETRQILLNVLMVMQSTARTNESWDRTHVYLCHLLDIPSPVYTNEYTIAGHLKAALDALPKTEEAAQ